jgi:hypothetical protein
MGTLGKVLGAANPPTAATDVTLYTVPGGTQAQISSMVIQNISAGSAKATVWVRVTGAAKTNAQIVLYPGAGTIAAGARIGITEGWTLNIGDVVTVQSDTNAALVFTLFGVEIA